MMAQWNLEEAIEWYRRQGAPGDQTALRELLKEVQQHFGGSIPRGLLDSVAEGLGVKVSLLLAMIRRIPSLHLADIHVLELCAGKNCGRHADLAQFAEGLARDGLTVRFIPCQRMCGKGPNIRYDGKLYHGATEELLKELTK